MKTNQTFLSIADLSKFYQDGKVSEKRVVPRQVRSFSDGRIANLETLATSAILSEKLDLKINCITVKPKDGMTWAAELVRERATEWINKERSVFHIVCLSRQFKGKLPQVIELIGAKRFADLARQQGLVSDFYSVFRLSTLLICLGSFITPILVGLVTNDISATGGFSNLLKPLYLSIAAVSLVLCFVARYFIQKDKLSIKPDTLAQLISDVEGFVYQLRAGKRPDNYNAYEMLLSAMAFEMLAIKPKLVIVDNFQDLDEVTRYVVWKYFLQYDDPRSRTVGQNESWIIFEQDDNERLSLLVQPLLQHNNTVFGKIVHYELQPLTLDQKKKFVTANGFSEERAHFVAISAVCEDTSNLQWVEKRLLAYRQQQIATDQFGKLEMLYLLALTSDTGRIEFGNFEMDTVFDTNKYRSELLKVFLKQATFTKLSIHSIRDALMKDEHLKDLIYIENDTICVTREAQLVLNPSSAYYKVPGREAFFESLRLPHWRVGHAFWALYWFDRLQAQHKYEIFWFDKLAFHLRNTGFDTLRILHNKELEAHPINTVLFYLLRAYIYTINGVLRTAAFRRVNIPELVSSAVAGAEEIQSSLRIRNSGTEEDWRMYRSWCVNLYAASWTAYICLRHTELIPQLARLNELAFKLPNEAAVETTTDIHAVIYGELIAPESILHVRDQSAGQLLFASRSQVESIETHIRLQARLFGFLFKQLPGPKADLLIASFDQSDYREVVATATHLQQVICSSTDRSFGLTDFVNYPLALWTIAVGVRAGYATREDVAVFPQIINGATAVLQHVLEDRFRTQRQVISNDFFLETMMAEIAGIAMASGHVMAASLYGIAEPKGLVDSFNELILMINKWFQVKYSPIGQMADLWTYKTITKTVSLLQSTGAVWHGLDFIGFENELNLRMFHLKLICHKYEFEDVRGIIYKEFPVLINPTAYDKFITNLMIAAEVHTIHNLYSALYFSNGLKIIEPRLSNRHIYHELLFIQVFYHGLSNLHMSVFQQDQVNSDIFTTFIKNDVLPDMEEHELDTFTLHLMNSFCFTKANFEQLVHAVHERSESLEDVEVKNEIDGFIQYRRFSQKTDETIRAEGTGKILGDWAHAEEHPCYPMVLKACLGADPHNQQLHGQIEQILKRSGRTERFNSYLILAKSYIQTLINKEEKTLPPHVIDYMASYQEQFENISDAVFNKQIYLILSHHAPEQDREKYRERYASWEHIVEEEKRLQFQNQLRLGNFFFAYYNMVTDLRNWLDDSIEQEIFYSGQAEEGRPAPLVKHKDQQLISDHFLNHGLSVFTDNAYTGAEHDALRNLFNELSHNAFKDVLNILVNVNGSERLKEITDRYRKAYSVYSNLELVDEGE
ncbi:MAG: hypothetical protein QM781_19560 [Chitinophagaceae bacterium]